jgi:hypothetical protein
MKTLAQPNASLRTLPPNGRRNATKPYRKLAMIAVLTCTVCLCLIPMTLSANGAASSPDQKTVSILMPAFLSTNLDSRKRNAGDQIEAINAAQIELPDGTVIPREAKIIGRVIDSKARSKGDPQSSLTIAFEKVELPQGKTLEIKGRLQAVAPNPNPGDSSSGVDYGTSMNRTLEHAGAGSTSTTSVPVLNAQSVGAQGLKDVALDDQGVLTSPGKTVKLDHGAQLMLKVEVISQ